MANRVCVTVGRGYSHCEGTQAHAPSTYRHRAASRRSCWSAADTVECACASVCMQSACACVCMIMIPQHRPRVLHEQCPVIMTVLPLEHAALKATMLPWSHVTAHSPSPPA